MQRKIRKGESRLYLSKINDWRTRGKGKEMGTRRTKEEVRKGIVLKRKENERKRKGVGDKKKGTL